MRPLLLTLVALILPIFSHAQTANTCGSSFDQAVPVVEILETRYNFIKFKVLDYESGIWAVGVKYTNLVGENVERVFSTVEGEFFNSLATVPNHVGHHPTHDGLNNEEVYTFRNIDLTKNVELQASDGCGFLSSPLSIKRIFPDEYRRAMPLFFNDMDE